MNTYLIALLVALSLAASARAAPLVFLVPHSTLGGERELTSIVDEYNSKQPGGPAGKVELVRRGEEQSTLREFMARHLAGDAPAIAALEASETQALGPALKLLVSPPPALRRRALAIGPADHSKALPFQRSVPILLANLGMIAVPSSGGPKNWSELGDAAIPLQGSRGLWLLEALTNQPLWQRKAGGLKANRALKPAIETLQKLVHHELGTEQAIQAFLKRQNALLVTSLDQLPYISNQANFRFVGLPLPLRDGKANASLQQGNSLVVTRSAPEVWNFLEYLYSPAISARWALASGVLPAGKEALHAAAWKTSGKAQEVYRKAVERVMSERPTQSMRSTDPEILRVRSEWIQALHLLFGEVSQRATLEDVLTRLDSRLSQSH